MNKNAFRGVNNYQSEYDATKCSSFIDKVNEITPIDDVLNLTITADNTSKLNQAFENTDTSDVVNESKIQFLGINNLINLLIGIKDVIFVKIKGAATDISTSFDDLRSDGESLDLYNVVYNSLDLYSEGLLELVDEYDSDLTGDLYLFNDSSDDADISTLFPKNFLQLLLIQNQILLDSDDTNTDEVVYIDG